MGAASGAGIAIGTYFAFYGAASNALARTTTMKPGGLLRPCDVPALEECYLCCCDCILQLGHPTVWQLGSLHAPERDSCGSVVPLKPGLEVHLCSPAVGQAAS